VHSDPPAPALNAGRTLHVLGTSVELLTTAAESQGAMTVARIEVPPGWANPPHMHWYEHECLYLLSGELEVTVGAQTFTLFPGHTAFGPRRIAHAFRNPSASTASVLLSVTPGGIERFFAAVHDAFPPGVPPDPARVADLIERHGMSIV
jgi:quercetin dioxygenase-like cupin family protein